MADLGTIDFSLIEPHKENIIPLSTGRSARALVTALTSNPDEHQAQREFFENELVTASELDDPLDVWARYVTWTINTYPSGNSSESQLLPLLERATRAFLHDSHYKNDPRYVKFWILYIQKFSDAPREHFSYLATNDIGQRLALFYEEFATWLESVGRRGQAKEVYQMGVENGARPRERLVRKFEEFIHRCEANPITGDEPRSPALPTVRPALAAKTLPFTGVGDPGYPEPQSQTSRPTAPKPKREKMAIFSDADNGSQAAPVLGSSAGGWDSIGTLEHRRKENIMEPTPWAGQTLKQQGGEGKAFVGEKFAIFRDTYNPPAPVAQYMTAASGAPSFPNAQYIYPDPTKPSLEYSFEELRARQRNLVGIDWGLRRREAEAKRKLIANKPNRRSLTPEIDFSLPSPRVQTIATKLHSPSPGKGKLKKRSHMIKAEPTMTLHTRAATDEVYDILRQPMDQPSKDLDAEGDGNDDESDFTDDDLTTNIDVGGRGGSSSDSNDNDGGSRIESGEEDVNSDWDDKEIDYIDETVGLSDDTIFQRVTKGAEDDDNQDSERHYSEDEEPGLPLLLPNIQPRRLFGDENHSGGGRKKPFMTPIAERTEVSLPPTTARRKAVERTQAAKTPSRPRGARTGNSREPGVILSSPFQGVVDGNGDADSGEESDFLKSPPPKKLDLTGGLGLKKRDDLKSPPSGTTARKPNSPTSGNLNGGGEGELPTTGKRSAPRVGKSLAPTPISGPLKTDIAHKGGPLIMETQINPMTPEMHTAIISKLDPPLIVYEGYYEYPATIKSRASEIRKSLKPPSVKATGVSGDKSVEVTFPGKPGVKGKPAQGQTKYIFQRQIAEGAFAPVYLVENTDVARVAGDEDDEEIEDKFKDLALVSELRNLRRRPVEAVKMQTDPPSPWEFYIMRQAHRRLGISRASESILHALECHVFPKEASFLVLPFQSQGTVLDLVNLSNKELGTAKPQPGMDETLTMFLAVELLRTIEALHSKGIIHGDLKPDNCLVRFEDVSDAEWESGYRKDGSGGWSKKGIVLIDFGRGIDMKIFTPNVQFVADWNPDPVTDCVEIRTMRPWTYQIDYHGCAGIIHSMLFGRYLETIGEKGGGVGGALLGGGVVGTGGGTTWRVRESFKRYWQGEIWTRCFDVLLNPGKFVGEEEAGKLPVTKAVRKVREEMEKWLEGNSEKGIGLRNMIKKLEGGVNKGRRW